MGSFSGGLSIGGVERMAVGLAHAGRDVRKRRAVVAQVVALGFAVEPAVVAVRADVIRPSAR